MANPNTPFGFRPTMRTFTGGSGTIQPTHKLVGYGTALLSFAQFERELIGERTRDKMPGCFHPGNE